MRVYLGFKEGLPGAQRGFNKGLMQVYQFYQGLTSSTVKSLAPICSSTTSTFSRALFYVDPQSQTEANKEEKLLCRVSWYKLTSSGVPDITSLPCRASLARLGRQGSMVVRLIFMPGFSQLQDIPLYKFYFVGSLVVDVRLLSSAFVMLVTLGAMALPQTHSARYILPCKS